MKIWMMSSDGLTRLSRSSAAWTCAALIVLGAALGCSKSEEPPIAQTPGSGAEDAPAEIPHDAMIVDDITPGVKGGILVVAMTGDPKTFNPPLSEDQDSNFVTQFLFDGLYDYDTYTQTDGPMLAKSWDYNEATMEWTFHLREGLRWSDGHPLTADDALFYTEVLFDDRVPTTERDFMKTAGGLRFEFSAPDPLTFVAKIPEEDSFAILSLGLIKPLPRHVYEEALKNGTFAEILGTNSKPEEIVCSGPFRLKEFKSGEKIVLEANPYFYQYDTHGTQLPYLDELVILNVPDFDAMSLRFQAGDLDMMDRSIPPQNLVILQDGQAEGDFTIYSPGLRLGGTHYWLNMKPGGSYDDDEGKRVAWAPPSPGAEPPPEIAESNFRYYVNPVKRRWFENVEFRRACSEASNRDAMVRSILFGEGAAIYSHEHASNEAWHNPDVPTYPYNPAKAAERLDAIDFIDRDGDGVREDPEGNPIRFRLITNKENNVREKIGVLLKEDLGKLGFDVTLQLLDFNDIMIRINDSYDYEACLLGLGSGVPPHPSMAKNTYPSYARMHSWNPNQPAPATEWEARIDELYAGLQRTFDVGEQRKIYGELQSLMSDNLGFIELITTTLHVAASNRIGNLKPTVIEPALSHNIAELFIKPK